MGLRLTLEVKKRRLRSAGIGTETSTQNENISNLALDVWELALSLDDVRELALLCSRSLVFQCNSRSDSSPCALARPRSSQCGVRARSDEWYLGVRLGKSATRMVELRSATDSCKKVGSGRCKSLYSERCRSSVPGNPVALVAYPVVVRPSLRHEPKNWNGVGADPAEQELRNWDVARADPTEQELRDWDVARADPTKQELGN
ncbi:hypothetical protein BHM03_00046454 [Ensete ventricosum]|nr:hypothetical protein BHM03_00046454 [Ensete ventricosum]